MLVNRDLQIAANRAVQAQRLSDAGIEPNKLMAIIKPVQINSGQVTKDRADKGSAASSFAMAYAAAFLVYFTIITQGIGLLRSVLEEKTNRISEVMVSSVRPGFLMAGKILGAGSAAVFQVLCWIAIVVIAAIVLSQGIFPPEVLNALNVEPLNLLAFILFFIFGFFLYAAMYAAMGSMVNSEQEAQSIQSLGILPLVVPMVFMQAMINDPLGRIATWLGMIPFTAPIAMPLRMASETIPLGQIAASLALLAAGMFAVTWVAGRIYRIGILSTGKKPNLAELMKWIKAA
jgi:ABC-2 type transport system permease protein